jgi:hypothetical protein
MAKFRIRRKKWRCGDDSNPGVNSHGTGKTRLLNEDGYMCCLGQCATQVGVRRDKIMEKPTPEDIQFNDKRRIPVLTTFDGNDSQLSEHAMRINDDESTTLVEKERLLKRLFSKFHHELEFVGQYEQATN